MPQRLWRADAPFLALANPRLRPGTHHPLAQPGQPVAAGGPEAGGFALYRFDGRRGSAAQPSLRTVRSERQALGTELKKQRIDRFAPDCLPANTRRGRSGFPGSRDNPERIAL
jgi:hypothetical protein